MHAPQRYITTCMLPTCPFSLTEFGLSPTLSASPHLSPRFVVNGLPYPSLYSSSDTGSISPNLLSLHTATASAADKQRLNVTCLVANCPILPGSSSGNSDFPVLCPLKFLKGSCSVLAKGFLQADAWVVSKDVVLKEVSSAVS